MCGARWPRLLQGPVWRSGPRLWVLCGHQCPGRPCPSRNPGMCPVTDAAPRGDWPAHRCPGSPCPGVGKSTGADPAGEATQRGGHGAHLVKAIVPLASPTLVLWGDRKGQSGKPPWPCPLGHRPWADLGLRGRGEAWLRPGVALATKIHTDCRRPPGAAAGPVAGGTAPQPLQLRPLLEAAGMAAPVPLLSCL